MKNLETFTDLIQSGFQWLSGLGILSGILFLLKEAYRLYIKDFWRRRGLRKIYSPDAIRILTSMSELGNLNCDNGKRVYKFTSNSNIQFSYEDYGVTVRELDHASKCIVPTDRLPKDKQVNQGKSYRTGDYTPPIDSGLTSYELTEKGSRIADEMVSLGMGKKKA